MPKLSADETHIWTVEDFLAEHPELAHLRPRKRGDTITLESGPKTDPVLEGEIVPVRATEEEPARGSLLEGVRDRALGHRPGGAVAWIERVVDLADEIGEAAFVEAGRVRPPDPVEPVGLGLSAEGILRSGGGREVVGRVASLLVEVDRDLGEEIEEELHPARGLGLSDGEPVAIEVEEVVVAAPARPGLVVLGGERLGVG